MRLDRDSYGSVAAVTMAGAAAVWACLRFIHNPWIAVPLASVAIWFCVFVIYFFRVPQRKRAGSSTIVTSAADGVVIAIENAFEPEFLKRECIAVRVYMNFFDVHANFWPVDGEVTYFRYHPGEHFLVVKPKASDENEHTCTCIRTPEGKDVFFKQIAGGFARRIVNHAEPGMQVMAGEQCGIIKFGSRMDIFLPCDAEVKVSLREVVKACESVIAEL